MSIRCYTQCMCTVQGNTTSVKQHSKTLNQTQESAPLPTKAVKQHSKTLINKNGTNTTTLDKRDLYFLLVIATVIYSSIKKHKAETLTLYLDIVSQGKGKRTICGTHICSDKHYSWDHCLQRVLAPLYTYTDNLCTRCRCKSEPPSRLRTFQNLPAFPTTRNSISMAQTLRF